MTSDAPAIEGILAVHHFHVTNTSNSATVGYALSKNVSGTIVVDEETYAVNGSGMPDEAFDITVKDWYVV